MRCGRNAFPIATGASQVDIEPSLPERACLEKLVPQMERFAPAGRRTNRWMHDTPPSEQGGARVGIECTGVSTQRYAGVAGDLISDERDREFDLGELRIIRCERDGDRLIVTAQFALFARWKRECQANDFLVFSDRLVFALEL